MGLRSDRERQKLVKEQETAGKTRRWPGYAVAVGGTALGVVIRWLLLRAFGELPLYLTFSPVVFAAALIGGTGPGVLATVLGSLASELRFGPLEAGMVAGASSQPVSVAFFVVVNLALSLMGGRFRNKSEALHRQEQWFHTLADAIPQLAWIARADGYVFWYNRRWYEYTGTAPEQVEGWGWQAVHEPQALPRIVERWGQSIATGRPFNMEFSLRGADGRFRPFLTRGMPLKDDQGRVVLWFGTNTDIQQLHERERALSRQARLIDLAPAATLVRRPDGTITFWSKGAQRLYGWSGEEALGRRTVELLHTVYPEPLESILAKLRGGGTWSGELQHTSRDGRQLVVQSYWLAELDERGEVEELLESNTDITERKRLQGHLEEVVEERTAELREAVAELEHLSYSMVHDMRAPLRAMQSFAGLLLEECVECRQPPNLDYIRRIRDASLRLDHLLTDALNYNRVVSEELPTAPVDLGRLLQGMLKTYPNLQPPAKINLGFEELLVLGNESLLTQCFGNLLDNAVKFVAPGVQPQVRVWAEPLKARASAQGPESTQRLGAALPPESAGATEPGLALAQQKGGASAPLLRVWVEDNGIGIPKGAQEKIFRMFQRMHRESEYPGTGIGLAIARKAVERMNGQVGFESEAGKGSRFWIELPKAA